MEKYKNKYRIPSARLQNWDYGSNGAYFITICTQNRECFFGEIMDTPSADNVETRFIASQYETRPPTPFIASQYETKPPTPFIASQYETRLPTPFIASQYETPPPTPFIASLHQTKPPMRLNEMGQLAEQYWLEIPNQFPFVELGNFVVMPNHVHGILIIDKNANLDGADDADDADDADGPDDVETRLIASLPPQNDKNGGFAGTKNPMFYENISRIIRWYKGRCSFEIRKIHADFAWQPRFYDHIIRNAQSFENIQNYIENNPIKWAADKFYSNNV